MAQTHRVGSLQIDQDLEFQRKEWTAQRAAWLVALLILLAGFVGLLGGGPLSHAEAAAGPLRLEYDRFARTRAATNLEARVDPGAAANGAVRLWLDRDFLDKVDIERIIPQPVEAQTSGDRVVYRFAAPDADQPAVISFDLQPMEPGAVRGQMGLVAGPEIAFTYFIYP
jgi:hypothetical protein